MPPSADNDHRLEARPLTAEDEHEFEKFKQGLRKLASYYRDRLARAEAALAALEGKPSSVEPRLNRAIKDFLARAGAPQTREEIKTELIRAGVVSASTADGARVDRSLRQCVNAATLAEQDGKFHLPPRNAP